MSYWLRLSSRPCPRTRIVAHDDNSGEFNHVLNDVVLLDVTSSGQVFGFGCATTQCEVSADKQEDVLPLSDFPSSHTHLLFLWDTIPLLSTSRYHSRIKVSRTFV